MPQPVHYSHQIHFDFRPESLSKRPLLAAHIATISGLWNDIEARIGIFLASLLGTEAETGVAIYVAITNDGAKRAAIDAICAVKLTDNDKERFQELLTAVGKHYTKRNKIVHGAWGVSKEYPDAILWCDIRDSMQLNAKMLYSTKSDQADERLSAYISFQKKIIVYKTIGHLD